jgi:hypothetical protein
MPNNVVYITKLQDGKQIKPMPIDEKTFQERKSFYSRDGWMVAPQSLIERYYELTPTKEKAEKPKAKKEEEKQP